MALVNKFLPLSVIVSILGLYLASNSNNSISPNSVANIKSLIPNCCLILTSAPAFNNISNNLR